MTLFAHALDEGSEDCRVPVPLWRPLGIHDGKYHMRESTPKRVATETFNEQPGDDLGGGLRNAPQPQAPKTIAVCPCWRAVLSTASILTLMSSSYLSLRNGMPVAFSAMAMFL